ncbi:guanylate kinase [Acidaminobacter sp.]|uniref:guanylate kinase n=1 Tax=Acidaminobacter sp. TaxID=1872102 RepID=UPI0013805599|nr:guanylate kinase [Acidaminobacter sp.]MDK9709633.1 guanylate kinase [Acidaminobacter sp.]MZQ97846.1 guanylate kinase [Acidaminobacter sp.]
MKRKGLLLVVSGPSGVGKGTICKALMKLREDIKLSISMTTRAPRPGEEEGINYFFTNRDAFIRLIQQGELLEYAKVYDNYYGTPKAFVMEQLDQGVDVLLEIDIQGALKVKEQYPEGVFVFILPPTMEELKNRIVGRGTESAEAIDKRFTAAYNEIDLMENYNYFIFNDRVDLATARLISIIEAERLRIRPQSVKELIREIKEESKC